MDARSGPGPTIALAPTAAGPWVGSGWVRGLVSGLGALDLAVALQVLRELWREMQTRTDAPDGPR